VVFYLPTCKTPVLSPVDTFRHKCGLQIWDNRVGKGPYKGVGSPKCIKPKTPVPTWSQAAVVPIWATCIGPLDLPCFWPDDVPYDLDDLWMTLMTWNDLDDLWMTWLPWCPGAATFMNVQWLLHPIIYFVIYNNFASEMIFLLMLLQVTCFYF